VAVLHGGALPLRAAVLDVAKQWSIPPWEIAPDIDLTRLEWFTYERYYTGLIAKKQNG